MLDWEADYRKNCTAIFEPAQVPLMQGVLTWCLRIVAVVLGALGASLAVVAVQSDWAFDDAAASIGHSGILAAGLSLFFIGCAVCAAVVSSRRRFSMEAQLGTVLVALICAGVLVFHYAAGAL